MATIRCVIGKHSRVHVGGLTLPVRSWNVTGDFAETRESPPRRRSVSRDARRFWHALADAARSHEAREMANLWRYEITDPAAFARLVDDLSHASNQPRTSP